MARQSRKGGGGRHTEPGLLITVAIGLVLGGLALIATAAQRWVAAAGWVSVLIGAGVGVWWILTRVTKWRTPLLFSAGMIFGLIGYFAIWTITRGVTADIDHVVGLSTESATARGGALMPSEENGFYILFPNLRITNNGIEPVVINAKLSVQWDRDVQTEIDPWLHHFPQEFWGVETIYPPLMEDSPFIFPINLAPKTSVQGSVAFLLPALDLERLGEGGTDHCVLMLLDMLTGKVTVAYETD